jgi:hypothetical protein
MKAQKKRRRRSCTCRTKALPNWVSISWHSSFLPSSRPLPHHLLFYNKDVVVVDVLLRTTTMSSAGSVLRLASRRSTSQICQPVRYAQRAALSQSASQRQDTKSKSDSQFQEKIQKNKAQDWRTAPPDLLSELRKAPRPRKYSSGRVGGLANLLP